MLRRDGRDAGRKGCVLSRPGGHTGAGSALLAEELGLFLSDSAKTGKEQRVGQDP